MRIMRELALCKEKPKVKMKSRFGPGRRQGSQSGTAFGCVFGSQALVMSAQVPVPKEPKVPKVRDM